MLNILPVILVAFSCVTAFPKETRHSACRQFPYETSVRSDDKGVSLRFKPSGAAVRQLLDVVAHFNVTCGAYFRYAEDHPMAWTGQLYTTNLRKDTLLQHCSEQNEYLGTLNNTVQVKVQADDAGKNFVTLFSKGLEPFTTYKLMISEKSCRAGDKEGSEGESSMEVMTNEDGELYQVGAMEVPRDKKTLTAQMVNPRGEMLACGELKPQMPEALLSYAFNFTIEDEEGKKVQCDTHVFQADKYTLLEDVPGYTGEKRERITRPQTQPSSKPMPRTEDVSPGELRRREPVAQPVAQQGEIRRRAERGQAVADTTGDVWTIPAFSEIQISGENQECNTALGRVCNPGLICAKDPTNQREEGICRRSSLLSTGNTQQMKLTGSGSARQNYNIPADAIRPQPSISFSDAPPAGFSIGGQQSQPQPQQRTQTYNPYQQSQPQQRTQTYNTWQNSQPQQRTQSQNTWPQGSYQQFQPQQPAPPILPRGPL